MSKIQTKEQIEDFMHDVISLALPHIKKSNIRPAFQTTLKNNPAGNNYIAQNSSESGLVGFTQEDDFIYFRVYADPNNSELESEVEPDDTTSYIRRIELTVYIYGEHSQNNALLLLALMRRNKIQNYLNLNGYYQQEEGSITPQNEEINQVWFSRTDVTFNFSYKVVLKNPIEDTIEYAKGYNSGNVPIIVEDN